jgi:ribosomal protein L3
MQNIEIIRADLENALLYLKGSIPGLGSNIDEECSEMQYLL